MAETKGPASQFFLSSADGQGVLAAHSLTPANFALQNQSSMQDTGA